MKNLLLATAAFALSCATAPAKKDEAVMTAEKKPAEPERAATLLAGTAEAFAQQCTAGIATAKSQIEALRKAPKGDAKILELYDDATTLTANLGMRSSLGKETHPNEAFRTAAEKCEQDVEAFNVELAQDKGIYEALASMDQTTMDPTTAFWVFKTLREFRRAGVDRDDATRAKVKALNEELVKIGQTFSKNIRDDVRTVHFTAAELDGLPADWLKAHAAGADGKIAVTSNTPDYLPVMTYARKAATREKVWREYRNRGNPKNIEVLNTMLAKRHELANLLGYDSWAAYSTENKMAKTAKTVADFIDKGAAAALTRARADLATLLARKKKDEPKATAIEPWEQDYYEDRVKAEQLGFDSQVLRDYFEYQSVKDGVMGITGKLFSVSFTPVKDARTWHSKVEVFDITDNKSGEVLGRIHLDMHPREGKYKHAAEFGMTTGRSGKTRPEAALVCNFAEPGGLLQHSEVETFFHEFGHLLHEIFAGQQRWGGISGIRTEWDFVEVPSMLLQEWPLDARTVASFARHNKTGEPIPTALLEKLRTAREFGAGLYTRRQFFLAAVSLAYHDRKPGFDSSKLLKELQDKYLPFRKEWVEGTRFELSFGHLEGYSAAYYTYLWSTVIAKDLLTRFQGGMLDPEVAGAYRKRVLEPGGSREAGKLVEDFLGRPYDFKAYETWLNAGK
jgi:thimet oligopeptidase